MKLIVFHMQSTSGPDSDDRVYAYVYLYIYIYIYIFIYIYVYISVYIYMIYIYIFHVDQATTSLYMLKAPVSATAETQRIARNPMCIRGWP